MKNKSPAIRVAVSGGKTYNWCSCGLSKSQPFCDGSHKNDEQGRGPVKFEVISDRFISFCTCKKSDLAPLCDGSHRKLEDISEMREDKAKEED
ncbi:CDGSH iron-sulfur domain-containing protein [Rickettsiales endosymbiont of Trichoplax sp. H2]|uniref:CDGSH iron-sulfur domain-containing protein n=1 Tax=Rickettsiales endosymbiont of Trichoplax sp. H2 TaxID=2021221 RepID=UPI0012B2B302|nr:CDGSH iron-sulfur domain-containing protein [Rickettsiales endosymbiont of Trichoplax sp. H2]MSO13505.1 CDGSH iron-sulfur domain-containing protein 3, mitochondrial [Rickettsiales endosymbiont of Trichoplax sp. H2]